MKLVTKSSTIDLESLDDSAGKAAEIMAKMAALRCGMSSGSANLLERTRETLDWKKQIAANPVISATVAAVLGFLLVPRQTTATITLPKTLADAFSLDEKIEMPIARKPGMIQGLATTVGAILVRNATGMAMSHLSALLQNNFYGLHSGSRNKNSIASVKKHPHHSQSQNGPSTIQEKGEP